MIMNRRGRTLELINEESNILLVNHADDKIEGTRLDGRIIVIEAGEDKIAVLHDALKKALIIVVVIATQT